MTTHCWQVSLDRTPLTVRGFRHASAARDHVQKHFFDPVQRWDLLCPESPTPADFLYQLRTADCDVVTRDLLDVAARYYQDVVERDMATVYRFGRFHHQPPQGKPYTCMAIVTESGIFAAFADGTESDLRTAFRPEPRFRRAPITNQDFRNAAAERLDKKIARSELREAEP